MNKIRELAREWMGMPIEYKVESIILGIGILACIALLATASAVCEPPIWTMLWSECHPQAQA